MKTHHVTTSPLGIMPTERRIRCSIVILLVGILVNLLPVIASAQTTPITLFNTGVDPSGAPLTPLGSVDPHWSIVPPSPGYSTPASAFTLTNQHIGNYVQSASSEWIWLNSAGTTPVQSNSPNYYFRETFFLPPGSNLATAFITGYWAVDNDGTILLNGLTPSGSGLTLTLGVTSNFTGFQPFTITGGFVSGFNTLDFLVDDRSVTGGLNITRLTGSVNVVPEPSTFALMGASGALLLAAMRFRRRHA